MRLALDSDPRLHLVQSYGEGYVIVAGERFTQPLLVSPTRPPSLWAVGSFEALNGGEQLDAQLAPLLQLGAEIVLLGVGAIQPDLSAPLRAAFRSRRLALECMNLGAACRTYNVLASEQRAVAAALFPGG